MSNTPVQEEAQEPPAQELSAGSGQTLPSRPLQPTSDHSSSKRVCFYKSGDYKFGGHRMVINARTFKTFDALLDALSKKVPLPFGVRTITTPRGTHLVKALDGLHDGGSYVCSDQKRVKPFNLDEVKRRQVPWNTTRPFSAGRQKRQGPQFGRRNEVTTKRPANVTDRVALRTPKRLVVIRNRDPTVKRTIVLQRRTAPTFDALLDYLSQILQFRVLKIFSTDGRRVDSLAGLILCSGVIVAAGNEPFRLGNYSFQGAGQMAQVMSMDTVEPSMLQPRTQNNKSLSSGRGSRNFSLSSERHIVNQIKNSRNGSPNGHLLHHNGSSTEFNHRQKSMETHGTGQIDNEHLADIVPQDDDIEKSFRVNQDGSMTVEMKVRLTIKEEEMLHWTTTLSRSSLSKGTVCASISESGNSSLDFNNAAAKESSSLSENETKVENHPGGARNGICFNDERANEGYTSMTLGKEKTGFKCTPTPGPRQVTKKVSVESVKTVRESGVQKSTLGHYSYMERTAGGETTDGYCVVKHSSSSSSNNRPIPKPRKTASVRASNKGSHSSISSSGVAEVLQIQNNGMEVTETVMHIYESQGCYDNYFANEKHSADGEPSQCSTPVPESKPSIDSAQRSTSNDCDVDFSCQPHTTDSLQRQKEEMLSLSSEPTPTHDITATNSQIQETVRKDKTKRESRKKMIKPARNPKSSTSTSSSIKKQKESIVSPSNISKHSCPDKLGSNASVEKKALSSSESARSGQKSRGADKPQIKKVSTDEKTPRKNEALKMTTPKKPNVSKASAKYNGHNVNTPTGRPQMKKNMSDILQPKKSLYPDKKTIIKPKVMTGNRIPSPQKSLQLSESFSMPLLNPSPSEIHQYVESWLEKVSPDPVPYIEEAITAESEPQTKVVFQIGGDSELDENSECQPHQDEHYPSPGEAVKASASCLSVPHCHGTLLHNERFARGLCASMPSVRDNPVHLENRLRPHKSAETIVAADNEASSSKSNILDSRAKIKPVLRELYSSIHCIRSASETNTTSNLEKSNSLPDFSTQVASVLGSSCKAFVSFLSVMTLRDNLTGSAAGDCIQSRSPSETMLMVESLQKISAIEDEEELRASLTELQSRASSQFRERWKDFQILRERLDSEPLSSKVSETEFALDLFSEGGDAFEDLDELMDELNMPQDLRAEISSTIHQAKSFYPVEDSTFVETEKNQSDSEEDVETFVEECNNETKQSLEPDITCVAEDTAQTKQDDDNGEIDNLKKLQSVYTQQAKMTTESEQEPDKGSEKSKTERDESVTEPENDEGRKEEGKHIEDMVVNDREDGHTEEIVYDNDNGDGDGCGEETEKAEKEDAEEGALTEVDVKGEEESEKEKGSVKEEEESVQEVDGGAEGHMTVDEKMQKLEEAEEGLMDEEVQQAREDDSVEETDEREGVEEIEEGEYEVIEESDQGEEVENIEEVKEEEEEEEEDKVDEVIGEPDQGMIVGNIEEVGEEEEKEADEVIGETDEGEEVENTEEVEEEEEEDEEEKEADKVIGETDEGEEVENIEEVDEEEDEEEKESDKVIGETDEGEEVGNIEEVEEEEEDEEEEADEVIGETDEEEEVDIKQTEEEEEQEAGAFSEDVEEEAEERIKLVNKEEEMKMAIEEEGEGDEENIEERDVEEDKTEVVSEEDNEKEDEEEEREQEVGEDGENVEVIHIKERGTTDEEEEDSDIDKYIEEEERCHEGEESRKELEKTVYSLEEEPEEDREVVEEVVENVKTGQMLNEEEREDDEEHKSNEFNEGFGEDEEQESKDGVQEENGSDDADSITSGTGGKNLLEESHRQSNCEEANGEAKAADHNTISSTKYSCEGQCEDDKGNGTDTVNELETHEGEEPPEERSNSLQHPGEISQELLDFVNSALQSSSLIFTYDTQGKIRIEPDNARVTKTKQIVIPKSRQDVSYGLKRLPSPSTSDLSDYRPETSESGGYKTQESVDIVTESGEEGSPVCRYKTNIPNRRTNVERANSKLSVATYTEVFQNAPFKSGGSFSSNSDTKASKEDLSYFSAASSQKADAEPATETTRSTAFTPEKDSADGVLIDQGRWLLKENHLIRKSPPVSLGMYSHLDGTSTDTGQANSSEDSPSHCKSHHYPLEALSSSELEEMAKPLTPKCTYYNMPHGSDSDPFLDDSSVKSGKKDASSVKGKGFRVSPMIDTSKTWASKNGSLSSFASVEFKIQDRKVHPEGESSAMANARQTSSGGGRSLQSQDSLDTLPVRCGQYCPIL